MVLFQNGNGTISRNKKIENSKDGSFQYQHNVVKGSFLPSIQTLFNSQKLKIDIHCYKVILVKWFEGRLCRETCPPSTRGTVSSPAPVQPAPPSSAVPRLWTLLPLLRVSSPWCSMSTTTSTTIITTTTISTSMLLIPAILWQTLIQTMQTR